MSVAIRLPSELEARLERLCEQQERSKSYVAVKALEQYIEDFEDYLEAEKRMRSRSKTISLEQLGVELGLGNSDKIGSQKRSQKAR